MTDGQMDRQTDKWAEFPLVDSTPVRGRAKKSLSACWYRWGRSNPIPEIDKHLHVQLEFFNHHAHQNGKMPTRSHLRGGTTGPSHNNGKPVIRI